MYETESLNTFYHETEKKKKTLIYEEKCSKLSTICSQISKQERNETDTRLIKNVTYETRLSQYIASETRPK